MTTTTHLRPGHETQAAAQAMFERILVGVDCTPQACDACRQAARLATDAAALGAATVVEASEPTADRDQLAVTALAAASEILGPHATTRTLYGLAVPQLLGEAGETKATLLAVGSHGRSPFKGIPLGGVAGELLRRAPCSVLIARPAPNLETFPSSIAVGLDGSLESDLALEIACDLARRRHSAVEGFVLLGGDIDARSTARALVEAAATTDLVIVGSPRLDAEGALAGISELVAHQANCSVLLVRARTDSASEQSC